VAVAVLASTAVLVAALEASSLVAGPAKAVACATELQHASSEVVVAATLTDDGDEDDGLDSERFTSMVSAAASTGTGTLNIFSAIGKAGGDRLVV
jgi:hypothetical protein